MAGFEMLPELVRTGLFVREYRDHRLEWMMRSGGADIVLEGMQRKNIRFSHELSSQCGRAMDTHEGGCHCGAVRFRVAVDRYEAIECNCSMCRMKANLHLIVPRTASRCCAAPRRCTTYRFNTGVAQHTFCRVCGIHPFYTPRSHPDCIDVNIRCLDGDATARFRITPFDGANWEANVDAIR